MAMNYGISTAICLGKAKEFAKEKDFHKIFLNLLDYSTKFASEHGFKIIEIVTTPPFDFDILSQIKYEIKEVIENFETSLHLPVWEINICALNPHIRKASIDETKNLIDLVKEVGIKKVSMHPGYYASMPEIYLLLEQKMKKISEKIVFDIFDYCKSRNIELSIENLPYNEPLFQTPNEFEPFIENGIGMLLDTAHAVTSGIDPNDFIEKFGNKITEVHLVDGIEGKDDAHLALGMGDVDYVTVLDNLQKINFKGPIILEFKSEEDTIESLNLLKKKKYL